MAAQDEREPGVVGSSSSVLGPMVQDIPERDIVVQVELPPRTNSKPEMGAVAAGAAVYDTSPPLPHQNPPPIPAETVRLGAPDIAQLFAMLAGMNEKMDTNAQQLENKMEGNTKKMEANINEEMKKMRGEMQQIGRGLQVGTARIVAVAKHGQRQAKWRRHVRRPTSWRGVHRRVRTG